MTTLGPADREFHDVSALFARSTYPFQLADPRVIDLTRERASEPIQRSSPIREALPPLNSGSSSSRQHSKDGLALTT
jgi:hypothetical protein